MKTGCYQAGYVITNLRSPMEYSPLIIVLGPQCLGCRPVPVAVIKVKANVKRAIVEAKGSTLTDHSTRQAAFTKVINLIKPSKDKSPEGFKEAIMKYQC